MAVNVVITRHACRRARERMGIPARAVHRAVQRAWHDGHALGYVRTAHPSAVCRAYGEFMFIFIKSYGDEITCVTILCINENREDRVERKSAQKRMPGKTLSDADQELETL